MAFEAEIGDCTCPHCSNHRAIGEALDKHFEELERNPPDPKVQAENRRRLSEATKMFRPAEGERHAWLNCEICRKWDNENVTNCPCPAHNKTTEKQFSEGK